MSRRVAWWLAAPALACVLPLLPPSPPQQQEQGEGADTTELSEERVRAPGVSLEFAHTRRESWLNEEARPRQSPFLIPRSAGPMSGSTTLGYLEWTPGKGDQIVLCEPTPDGDEIDRRVVSETPAEIIRPIGLLDAQGRARIFWTELVDGLAELRGTCEQGKGFGAPVTLTGVSPPAAPGVPTPPRMPCMNVEGTLHSDGRIWLAWESETPPAKGAARGSRDVYVAPLAEDGTLGASVIVGDGPFSDLDPVIVSAGDKLWIAWVGYGGRDYEIRLRSLDPKSGALSAVIPVSDDSASDDLHPSLAAAPDGDLWIAWDQVENSTRGESAPAALRVHPTEDLLSVSVRVACVRGGQVLSPKSKWKEVPDGVVPGAPLLSMGGGVPRIGVDGQGRPWIAYRYLTHNGTIRGQEGSPVIVQRLDASGWSSPIEIENSYGAPEEVAFTRADAGILAAFQCDRRFDRDQRRDRLHVAPSVSGPLRSQNVRLTRWYGATGIGLAHASCEPAADGEIALVPRAANTAPPHFHPFADRLDDPLITGAQHFEIARGPTKADPKNAEKWQVFWGDLHRHSNVSRCSRGMEPSPMDRWEWGRDIHLYDFMALTDHSGQMVPFAWWQLDKLCWLYQSPTFCTLSGWEWSTLKYGHHNVILPGRMSPFVGDDDSIDVLYERLKPGECVTIPHHSADLNFPNDFAPVDDRFTRLIEIYQACRGNFEFDGCFKQSAAALTLGSFAQDALNAGHKFGIIASTDHDYGQSYACVLASSLDRASIFDALLKRRTYGATAKGLLVELHVDDAIMGEEVSCSAPPRVRVRVQGSCDLAEVVVFKKGFVWKSFGREHDGALNQLAPTRLVVRLPVRAGAPDHDWKLEVQAKQARFDKLDDRRRFTARKESPSWSFSESSATLTWPAGFEPKAASAEHALHARASDRATFVFKTPGNEARATFAELRARPLSLDAPGGKCTISIEAGDAVVDLAKGLGQRDFAGEWEDADLKPGAAWYYVRMIQTDGEMAWSSPIFVERTP